MGICQISSHILKIISVFFRFRKCSFENGTVKPLLTAFTDKGIMPSYKAFISILFQYPEHSVPEIYDKAYGYHGHHHHEGYDACCQFFIV